jgi:hypothetical protein
MPIEAPVSKFRKKTIMIYIAICLGLIIWCVYDGYFNKKFAEKYTDEDGNPTGWLMINRKAPPYLLGAAVLLSVYLLVIRNKKIVADEDVLVLSSKEKIVYDSIEKIDKTYFDKKGYFIITYNKDDGRQVDRKISDKDYDNLSVVLEHLVTEIS